MVPRVAQLQGTTSHAGAVAQRLQEARPTGVASEFVPGEGGAIAVVAGHFYVERRLGAQAAPRRGQRGEARRAHHAHHAVGRERPDGDLWRHLEGNMLMGRLGGLLREDALRELVGLLHGRREVSARRGRMSRPAAGWRTLRDRGVQHFAEGQRERWSLARRCVSRIRSSTGTREVEETKSERVFTEGPDGRVFGVAPDENAPKALTFDAAGEAA